MRTHCLYRFFDIDDNLLYVGITGNLEARTGHHRKHKAWWRLVATMTVERFDSLQQCEIAERTAIRDENPVFNIARHSPASLHSAHFQPVISTCHVCAEPVMEELWDGYDEEVLTNDHDACREAVINAFRRGMQHQKEKGDG